MHFLYQNRPIRMSSNRVVLGLVTSFYKRSIQYELVLGDGNETDKEWPRSFDSLDFKISSSS